jgi:hypothetical protein
MAEILQRILHGRVLQPANSTRQMEINARMTSRELDVISTNDTQQQQQQ